LIFNKTIIFKENTYYLYENLQILDIVNILLNILNILDVKKIFYIRHNNIKIFYIRFYLKNILHALY